MPSIFLSDRQLGPRGDSSAPSSGVHPFALFICAIVFLGASWVAVGLRIWTRARLIRSFSWDDGTIIVANIFFSVFVIAGIIDVTYVVGEEYAASEPNAIANVIDWLIVAEVFYIVTMVTFKISLAFFFLRLVKLMWERFVVYAAVAMSIVFGVAYLLFSIFECGVPTDRIGYALKRMELHCAPAGVIAGMGYTHAVTSCLTDWIFAVLPIPLLIKTPMPVREKVIVVIILAMGTVGSICSIIRIQYISQFTGTSMSFYDFALWSILEPAIGIMASCLATLRPLLRLILYGDPKNTSRGRKSSPSPPGGLTIGGAGSGGGASSDNSGPGSQNDRSRNERRLGSGSTIGSRTGPMMTQMDGAPRIGSEVELIDTGGLLRLDTGNEAGGREYAQKGRNEDIV